MHSYIAAFDLDKTILTLNSSRLVVKTSRQMGLMSKRDFIRAIYYSIVYKFDLKDANQIVSEMTGWLHGLKESDIIDLIHKHVIPEMLELIRPEIQNEISEHRKNNGKLIILSSAMPYLCEPISKYLGMDDVVCSKLQTKDGVFTGKPDGKLVFGKEKKVRMNAYCVKFNLPLETAWYYGDAFTDRFVLNAVANPVCVKPELKLGRLAKRNGWKII
jgi:HAD superfamily phosphoserine phosphatase-like hydrolase